MVGGLGYREEGGGMVRSGVMVLDEHDIRGGCCGCCKSH